MAPKTDYEQVIVKTSKFTIVQESLPPHTAVETHRHDDPFVIIPITGGKVEQLDADGNLLYDLDYKDLEPGHFLHMTSDRLPVTHSLRNVSDEPWVHLRIEYTE